MINKLKDASKISYIHGPQGGNKRIRYERNDANCKYISSGTILDKNEVLQALDFLKKNKIRFTDEIFP